MSPPVRVGAYLLAADPTWIRSSLRRYYDRLDALVVSAPRDGCGWTGHPVAVDACLDAVREVDTRGIARVLRGDWRDRARPMRAETAQRQDALAELAGEVDWVLQLDGDEVLPDVEPLLGVLAQADELGAVAVEWPMRVLYRRLRNGTYLNVTAADGSPRYEYPGPVAVRPEIVLTEARRAEGAFLRVFVDGDRHSAEVNRPAEADETRLFVLSDADAILHNSWARSPASVRRKIASWGHNQGLRSQVYYWRTWRPAPLHWRSMRDLHPMAAELWPRLGPCPGHPAALLDPADR